MVDMNAEVNTEYGLETIFPDQSLLGNRKILDIMSIPFEYMLTNQSPRAQQPSSIKLSLKPHQLALVEGMRRKEVECMEGFHYKGTTTFSNYGILGDDVGTGKSLVVLSYIATMKELYANQTMYKNSLYKYSSSHIFTVQKSSFKNPSEKSLIVVPHTIYKQWEHYCQQQTTLNVFYAKSAKCVDYQPVDPMGVEDSDDKKAKKEYKKQKKEMENMRSTFLNADIVLVSNTLYGEVQNLAQFFNVKWTRVFLDEADSIHITSYKQKLNGIFTWFITATWPNFVLNGLTIRPSTLQFLQDAPQGTYSTYLEQWLQKEMGLKQVNANNVHMYGYGKYITYRIRSSSWLREYESNHVLCGHMVLHCTPEFLQESEKMPPIVHSTVLCEQPISSRVVRGIVSQDIQAMLDAGSIESAMENLGVAVTSSTNIVDAVTTEREKELRRLQKTLEFKQSMEYATPLAKEQAIAVLKTKIYSVEEQLKVIKERLGDANTTEECPVCYENAKENNCTLTPCCSRMFCGACILTSLTRTSTCPMCRADLKLSQLTHIVAPNSNILVKRSEVVEEPKKLRSKPKELLHFLKKNPEARVLIFSRYENPFHSLESSFQEAGITHHILKGNKDVIAGIIRAFESGEKRVLFLPTESAAAGMNLVSATHVVLLHAMTPDEEKQVIGRAYRLGRSLPLNVMHLLHEGETTGIN